jgi:pimeloyl-ACP methyl ester carboxylesterase
VVRKWLALALTMLLLLPVQAAGAATAGVPAKGQPDGKEGAPKSSAGKIGIASYSPGDAIAEPDEEFVADSHFALDYYTFRSEGPIRFPINIDRYFGPVDGDGHLLHPENIEGQKALLTLRVWDVDQNAVVPPYAPEVDRVSINGTLMGTLSGSDSQWSTFTVEVPVSQLKFPTYDPVMGLTAAENWVQIDIDTANVGVCECWAVEVDWGRLVIKGIRPAVLIHGFMSEASTWDAWDTFADSVGLPLHRFSFANNHGSWFDHANEVQAEIDRAKQMFGVEKVNIVGHSKGGLDSRNYLSRGGDDVVSLTMLGTPNAGSPLADIVKAGGILSPLIGLVSLIGEPALTELTTVYMNAIGNRVIGQNPNAVYNTVAGDWDAGGWIKGNPLIWGNDDGVVAVTSVEALPYASSFGHTASFHTAMTSGAAEFNLAKTNTLRIAGLPGASATIDPLLVLSNLSAGENPGGTVVHPIAAISGAPVVLGVLWGGAPLPVTLTAPSGAPVMAGDPGVEVAESVDPILGMAYTLYYIESPETGDYQLATTNATGSPAIYLVAGATAALPTLSAAAQPDVTSVGSTVAVTATLDWGATSPAPMTVTAMLEGTAGAAGSITLADDGLGMDAAAGDSVYTGAFTPTTEGFFMAAVTAQSTDPAQPVQRIASTGFQVLSAVDHYTGTYSHHGVDSDGNGLYEALEVTADVSIMHAGTYQVAAEVTDSSGNTLANAGRTVSLGAGAGSVTLSFDGMLLGAPTWSGDLILTNLSLVHTGGAVADFKAPATTMSGYAPGQFVVQPLQVGPGIADTAVDTNGNGLYDELRITIPVTASLSGTYDFNARLMDSAGGEIQWRGSSQFLAPGSSTLTLTYDGELIGQNGVNGPFYVRDFSLYRRAGGASVNVFNLHTTAAYPFTQFEGAPVRADGLYFVAPLSSSATANWPAADELPIGFEWIVGGSPVLDTSVNVRIRDQAGRLVTSFAYGSGITYDPATGRYLQPFDPARYGLTAGQQFRVQVYIGGKLRSTAWVALQ